MTDRPFIPVARPVLKGNEKKYLEGCITSGWVSSRGSFIDAFEQRFAELTGARYAMTTSNGTTALHLALLALGIGPGDEVLVPSLTFAASAAVIVHVGATPVFVDVRHDTWNIDEKKISEKITPKTKAIMVVHLYGYPAALNRISQIAQTHNLSIIEDAAEAMVSTYDGKYVGNFGDVGCFSFFANKIITTGEGGMCITNNKELLDHMAILKNHGMTPERRYWHTEIAYNYRMTNLQAALGVAQLEQLDSFIAGRKAMIERYRTLLADCSAVVHPAVGNEIEKPIYWMYSILLPTEALRDSLATFLGASGVETRPVFPALIDMPIYKRYTKEEDTFPATHDISKRGLTLPSSADLTEEESVYITNMIKQFCVTNHL